MILITSETMSAQLDRVHTKWPNSRRIAAIVGSLLLTLMRLEGN